MRSYFDSARIAEVAACAALSYLASGAAASPMYTLVKLYKPAPGLLATGDSAIADGPAVGKYNDVPVAWINGGTQVVLANLSGITVMEVVATDGAQQVGPGSGPASYISGYTYNHAILWQASAGLAIDLNPEGVYDSAAVGASGGQQVGEGKGPSTGNVYYHAFLWSGSAQSAVDLQPPVTPANRRVRVDLALSFAQNTTYAVNPRANVDGIQAYRSERAAVAWQGLTLEMGRCLKIG